MAQGVGIDVWDSMKKVELLEMLCQSEVEFTALREEEEGGKIGESFCKS